MYLLIDIKKPINGIQELNEDNIIEVFDSIKEARQFAKAYVNDLSCNAITCLEDNFDIYLVRAEAINVYDLVRHAFSMPDRRPVKVKFRLSLVNTIKIQYKEKNGNQKSNYGFGRRRY